MRPVIDTWCLARPKLRDGMKYYGAYPSGFLERARYVLGAPFPDPILHVCGGAARFYKWKKGFGPEDRTMDLDPETQPDFHQDAREPWKVPAGYFQAILIDPPYSPEDAENYRVGRKALPCPKELLVRASEIMEPGGRVGILLYGTPVSVPGLEVKAYYPIIMGQGNKLRCFTVLEKVALRGDVD